MKEQTFRLSLLAGLLLGALTMSAQVLSTNAGGGQIQFAEPVYNFGKIKAGEVVKHSFIFTNVGAETLTVSHVQPQCGCTAAGDWTRTVEPGQTGVIPVQFNSLNFGGPVLKTVSVTSSASRQPTVLQLKGEIWKPIDVTPQFAVINVPPDMEGGSTSVRIVNNTQEDLHFSQLQINNKAFKAVIEPSTNNPGKEYTMRISTVGSLPQGSVQGIITVDTGSTNLPTVRVTAWANVQPALVVLPGQITLPAGPLANAVSPSVLVQNNSTNALTISEPSVNVPDVKVDVRETQPGKQFSIALTFPKGYENPAGKQVVFTAKSSHPSMPDIRVPVAQMPRALAPVRPPQAHSFITPVPPAVATH